MVTQQYLKYLELMELMDLGIAGDFLVMAATLMQIKSKMLLPKDPNEIEEAEEADPRAELVKRLLEYKRFKEAAMELQDRALRQKDFFGRKVSNLNIENDASNDEYFEASLFDLITAFTKVMKEIPKELFHEVIKDEFTVEEKIHDILHVLAKQSYLNCNELFKKAKNKIEIITTFLAILEIVRLKEAVLKQSKAFADIRIERNTELIKPSNKKGEAL